MPAPIIIAGVPADYEGLALDTLGERELSITLTNATIKDRTPTFKHEIVPAPPTGYRNEFVRGSVVAKFTDGGYGGMAAGDFAGYVAFEANDGSGYGSDYVHNEAADPLYPTIYTDFFAIGERVTTFAPLRGTGLVSATGYGPKATTQDLSQCDGNIVLTIYNNGADFTLGHANNTLTATVVYRLVALPV